MPDTMMAAGMRAAVESLGLKPVIWREFGRDVGLWATASVGAYDLEVCKALPTWKKREKIESPTPFYWHASAGGGDFSIAGDDGYASAIEAKLAAEAWLREELLQYIPYCAPCDVEDDDVHS